MALTVEQLRTYDSNWANLVVQQDASGTQVKGGGLKHALASLFRTDAAQARNKATYTAIRNAIMQDDRFFAPEVKAKADELLKGLDNGSVIRASTIKGIIRQLDAMSTPEKQKEALKKAAVGHLAATGVPANIPASVQAKYKELAVDFVVSGAAHGVSPGAVKVDKRMTEFNNLMLGIFRSVGSGADAQEVFCATLNNYTPRDDGSVSLSSPSDRLQGLADAVKDNLRELDEIGNSRGAAIRQSYLATLKRTGGVPHGALTELANKGAVLPHCELDFISGQSDAYAIHRAVSQMADAMDKARADLPRSLMKDMGPDEAGACLVKAAVARLPQLAKRNLLAALSSNAGMNLLGYYAQNGANPKAQRMNLVYSSLLTHLRAELDGADPGATVPPPNVDAAMLPSNALSDVATDLNALIVGRGTQQFRDALIAGSGLDKAPDPLAELKGRMKAICKGSVAATIFTGMDSLRAEKPPEPGEKKRSGRDKERIGPPNLDKTDTAFNKDFVRFILNVPDYIRIRLNDGTSVSPKTLEEARDALAKFVSGNPDATFAQLTDAKIKTKVNILMCCMHQAACADLATAIGNAFDPNGVDAPFAIARSRQVDLQKFTLSSDENGAITLVSHIHQKALDVTVTNLPPMPYAMYEADDGSFWDASMEVTFPADSLDKLASADWSKLDTADLRKALRANAPHATEKIQDEVTEEFRFTLDTNVSFRFHADTLKTISTVN